jgi:hypothetical protein
MEHREEEDVQAKHQVIPMNVATLKSSAPTLAVWNSYSFAPEWFKDALHEARTGQDHHSRRREILFAVCFVESYLFEWVRDEVLSREFDQLSEYFPPKDKRGIRERWKEVIKKLKKDNRIPEAPGFGYSDWNNFVELVKYRNGLVHAGASRPETNSPRSQAYVPPKPSKTALDRLQAGWAVSVVVELVRNLHKAVRTPAPQWLKNP